MATEKVVNKTRKWFLTINENAMCYTSALEILKGIENLEYAIINHNKDNEEQPHFHAVLNYKNARTFEQVQKVFVGSHIEVLESMYLSCRYLLHLDNKDKYQYELNEVISNSNMVEYYMNNDEFEKLDVQTLFEGIADGSLNNMTSCVKKFGLRQTNVHKNLIRELIEENQKNVSNSEQYEIGYQEGMIFIQNQTHDLITQYEQQILEMENAIKIQQQRIQELNGIISEYETYNLLGNKNK